MGKPPQDHRKYLRVRAEALVLVQRAAGGTQLARGLDLGACGIRFRCFGLDLEVDEAIEVTLDLGNNNSVTLVGKAVRVTGMEQGQEVALAFDRVIDPETFKRLSKLWQADES